MTAELGSVSGDQIFPPDRHILVGMLSLYGKRWDASVYLSASNRSSSGIGNRISAGGGSISLSPHNWPKVALVADFDSFRAWSPVAGANLFSRGLHFNGSVDFAPILARKGNNRSWSLKLKAYSDWSSDREDVAQHMDPTVMLVFRLGS